jgi:hypothetical protein
MVKRSHTQQVDLLETLNVLHEHLTGALCEQVFDEHRTTERRRKWSLQRLAEFWVEVTLQAPPSLRHALAQAQGGASGYPAVPASPQAFYARAQSLPWRFFAALLDAFRSRAVEAEPPRFLPEVAQVLDRFGVAVAIDGSKLDAVARRLKALWDDRRVPLPGSLVAVYDLRRGVLHRLAFNPQATPSEFHDAIEALDTLPRGSLTLVDRLYGVPAWFAALNARGLYGVARRRGGVNLQRSRRLSRRRHAGGWLEDWEVDAGTGPRTQRLRLIRWQKGKTVRELLTNVLDPERLSAAEAMALYPHRWKVETGQPDCWSNDSGLRRVSSCDDAPRVAPSGPCGAAGRFLVGYPSTAAGVTGRKAA